MKRTHRRWGKGGNATAAVELEIMFKGRAKFRAYLAKVDAALFGKVLVHLEAFFLSCRTRVATVLWRAPQDSLDSQMSVSPRPAALCDGSVVLAFFCLTCPPTAAGVGIGVLT